MRKGLILLLVLIINVNLSATFCQVLKSKLTTISINNLDNVNDTVAPKLSILSPILMNGEVIETDFKELSIVGSVKDDDLSSLMINAKTVLTGSNGIFRTTYKLEKGINNIQFIAMDINNNVSEILLKVYYIPKNEFTESLNILGKYYALLIAVEEYNDPTIFSLDNPINDAELLNKTIRSRYLFESEDVYFLKNPSRSEIINSLDQLSGKITEDDNLFVFYAGHGVWDDKANIGYWLPSDASKTSKANWLRNSTVQDYLQEIQAKHVLLVTDACFGGSIFKSRSIELATTVAIKKLYELPSRKAMTSGTLTEVPDESVFVKYFIDRLNNNDQPFIAAQELFTSFRIAVINNSDVLPQYGVIKNVGDEGGDFIFILRK